MQPSSLGARYKNSSLLKEGQKFFDLREKPKEHIWDVTKLFIEQTAQSYNYGQKQTQRLTCISNDNDILL